MTAIDIEGLIDSISADEYTQQAMWSSSIQRTIDATNHLKLFSHKRLLTKVLQTLVKGGVYGQPSSIFTGLEAFISLIDNVSIDEDMDAPNHIGFWDAFEFTFTVKHTLLAGLHTLPGTDDHFATLKQQVEQVGGSLSVARLNLRSMLIYQLTIPFYACDDEDDNYEAPIARSSSTVSLMSQIVVKTRADLPSIHTTRSGSSSGADSGTGSSHSGRRSSPKIVPSVSSTSSGSDNGKQRSLTMDVLRMVGRYTTKLFSKSSCRVDAIKPQYSQEQPVVFLA